MSTPVDHRAYSVWLAQCLGAGSDCVTAVAEFGSEQAFFEAGEIEWRMLGVFKPAQLQKLTKRDLTAALRTVAACESNGWHILSQSSELYPTHLKKIVDAPALLYVWGNPETLKRQLAVSIVGARDASTYGKEVAFRLSASLVQAGALVVSGGAVGIDTAAHEGAISAGGDTVAVMGCGLGAAYLPENEALRNHVSKNGAVISEYAPFTMPSRGSFPQRNRIISGMSLATVIVEAGEKSGSLGTARHALSQGRDVCAVPGDLISSAYIGSNILIANGAKPVFSAADILSDYVYTYPELISLDTVERKLERKPAAPAAKQRAPETLTPEQRKVYELFGAEPLSYDALVARSGMSPPALSQTLTELEIEGLVTGCGGNRYTVVK